MIGGVNRLRSTVSVAASLLLPLIACSLMSQGTGLPTDQRNSDPRPGYVGDAACAKCHAHESTLYAHTAHRMASQLPSSQSVLGSLGAGANLLQIMGKDADAVRDAPLPLLSFRMEQQGEHMVETALTGWPGNLHRRSEQIDLVTGSGVRGQTYLYWQGDRLFELPVSYWSEGHRWINSPGYIDGTADFSRPVYPGCLECHASYIRAASSEASTNRYAKDTLVTGIGCETCHGGGAKHVARYSSNQAGGATNPTDQPAILNPAKFARDLQIDACAVCHGGTARTALQPAFSFVPGRPLSEYFTPLQVPSSDHPDVHGDRVGLLEKQMLSEVDHPFVFDMPRCARS